MKYRDFFINESWKDYVVSTNPEVLLYDFYVLSYLTTLPLDPTQKGYTGSLIGRDANEIKMDIDNAENKLLPVLQKKLSDAIFIAICAEIRHIMDRPQKWGKYADNRLLKNYIRNYKALTELPSEFKPTRNIREPKLQPQQKSYTDSYKAAIKAIKETGSNKEQFASLAADLFRNLNWAVSYGGPKWAEIAEAYNLLNKSPQTKQQLQVAIDHAYDLQHNTGAVLNKVKEYYINKDISWLRIALDFKANLKSVYSLLPKCSSDMRKLALEAFKSAGVRKDKLETTTSSGEPVSQTQAQVQGDEKFKIGDTVIFKNSEAEIEGVIIGMSDSASNIKVTKVINTIAQQKDLWTVGTNVKVDTSYLTKKSGGDSTDKGKQFGVGDFIRYKAGTVDNVIDILGTITAVDATMDEKSSIIKISKINSLPQSPSMVASRWKIGQKVLVYKAYMTKMGEKTTFDDDNDSDLYYYQSEDAIVTKIRKSGPQDSFVKVKVKLIGDPTAAYSNLEPGETIYIHKDKIVPVDQMPEDKKKKFGILTTDKPFAFGSGWKSAVGLSNKPSTIKDAIGLKVAIMSKSNKKIPDKVVKVVGVSGLDSLVVSYVGNILDRKYKIDELEWLDSSVTATKTTKTKQSRANLDFLYGDLVDEVKKDLLKQKVFDRNLKNIINADTTSKYKEYLANLPTIIAKAILRRIVVYILDSLDVENIDFKKQSNLQIEEFADRLMRIYHSDPANDLGVLYYYFNTRLLDGSLAQNLADFLASPTMDAIARDVVFDFDKKYGKEIKTIFDSIKPHPIDYAPMLVNINTIIPNGHFDLDKI